MTSQTAIETVSGEIEFVGQHYLNGSRGVSYTLVRFVADDGRVISKANVAADNELSSYVSPGSRGVFAFHAYQKANVLCGYAGGGRIVAEPNQGMAEVIDLKRKLAWLSILLGVVTLLFLIGVVAIIYGVYLLSQYPKLVSPSRQEIEAALARGGRG